MPISVPKVLTVILLQIVIALVHLFRLGRLLDNPWYSLYYSYFSDLLLPFGAYFLLSVSESGLPVLRPWYVKAGLVFSVATTAEICQLCGVYTLGITFDILDIVAYAAGVLFAALIDVKILSRYVGFWAEAKQ